MGEIATACSDTVGGWWMIRSIDVGTHGNLTQHLELKVTLSIKQRLRCHGSLFLNSIRGTSNYKIFVPNSSDRCLRHDRQNPLPKHGCSVLQSLENKSRDQILVLRQCPDPQYEGTCQHLERRTIVSCFSTTNMGQRPLTSASVKRSEAP